MPMSGGLLQGKKGLVLGVANDKSIAWGIARAAHEHGAQIAFTYQSDALLKRVQPLIDTLGGDNPVFPCDVSDDASLDALFASLKDSFGTLDFVVHGIAFSDKDELKGKYLQTTRENFRTTMDISVYSFVDIARRSAEIMNDGGSMLTLSYLGAERVVPHYNVMGVAKAALEASTRYLAADLGERGIRVNAISAGPIRTLAAMGIGDFRNILKWNEANAPLRRNVTTEEVGGSGLYLLSDLARGVTGEVHYVDSGYHLVGMLEPASLDENIAILTAMKKD
ncbi:SDR family oxidoreductase [Phaeovibrio sulfidiphilus]|uniref:Enoyl-[acyl-carrier-protein] reductase [NADH] n=1 Tax=Phaeovibrio sulfidiphilus TaxID=1220600 RepID=A0A8J6YWI8_9PROT|nr:SDR family oxidoreductase [Phaeovibrio sulfidiphilus]MBE1237754.1 SDR family oxidoreductase [Phaeovibrio sulfidiphilus]